MKLFLYYFNKKVSHYRFINHLKSCIMQLYVNKIQGIGKLIINISITSNFPFTETTCQPIIGFFYPAVLSSQQGYFPSDFFYSIVYGELYVPSPSPPYIVSAFRYKTGRTALLVLLALMLFTRPSLFTRKT